VTDAHWSQGHYGFLCIQHLDKQLGRRLQVSSRTVERWLRIYRKNPDVMALMPRARGHRLGIGGLRPSEKTFLRR
jgi:transcriptional regulator with XRE-family HTH domain